MSDDARTFELRLLDARLAVCRLEAAANLPDWAKSGPFVSVTRTPDELSIVCPSAAVPDGVRTEPDWRALVIAGTLDFSEVGVLASLTSTLAKAGVSVFAISTFDSDWLLVRQADLRRAESALVAAGNRISPTTAI